MLGLYLVAPKGYESRLRVVVAEDDEGAKEKALTDPDVKEIIDAGGQLLVLDISNGLYVQGFKVLVEKIGVYH